MIFFALALVVWLALVFGFRLGQTWAFREARRSVLLRGFVAAAIAIECDAAERGVEL